MIKESIDSLQTRINHIDVIISELIKNDSELTNEMNLLISIPAIGQRTALQMLTLFHGKDFDNAGAAAAYVGLVPIQKQS
ncbi:transposase, partial [Acinetobacter baumannii]